MLDFIVSINVLIIGGTGHIDSHLVTRLVCAGHGVSVLARRPKPQYKNENLYWPSVRWIIADRAAEEASGAWATRMAATSNRHNR